MGVIEYVDKFEEDMRAAMRESDGATRNLLILDSFREMKNKIMNEGYVESGDAPVVDIGTFKFTESRYVRGKRGWMASSLYKKVEEDGLKPFDVPLASIDLTPLHFKVNSTDSFILHMKRCMNADTDIPILLDDMGQVVDGNHRICKAILDGKRYIKAYRMKDMPAYDFNEEQDD